MIALHFPGLHLGPIPSLVKERERARARAITLDERACHGNVTPHLFTSWLNPNLRLTWSRWCVGQRSSGPPLQPTVREKKEKETLEIGRRLRRDILETRARGRLLVPRHSPRLRTVVISRVLESFAGETRPCIAYFALEVARTTTLTGGILIRRSAREGLFAKSGNASPLKS